jgi:hypothetical protein
MNSCTTIFHPQLHRHAINGRISTVLCQTEALEDGISVVGEIDGVARQAEIDGVRKSVLIKTCGTIPEDRFDRDHVVVDNNSICITAITIIEAHINRSIVVIEQNPD